MGGLLNTSPPQIFRGCQIWAGAAPQSIFQNFYTRSKIFAHPTRLRKNHCPCIFEGHFSTIFILSTFHLQGPKSNIYDTSIK